MSFMSLAGQCTSNAPDFHSGGFPFDAIFTEFFRGCPKFLQENATKHLNLAKVASFQMLLLSHSTTRRYISLYWECCKIKFVYTL
jgi:hypothetical protein